MGTVEKIRLKDEGCKINTTVIWATLSFRVGDAQGPFAALCLGDIHPFDRAGAVAFGLKFSMKSSEDFSTPFSLRKDVLSSHSIDPTGFTFLANVFLSGLQHVHPEHPVLGCVEAELGFVLRFLIQLSSQRMQFARQEIHLDLMIKPQTSISRRTTIKGWGLQLRENIENKRLIVLVTSRLVELSRDAAD